MKIRWFAASVALAGMTSLFIASPTTSRAETPRFYKDVLPIFQERCMKCHREGELAPMPLDEYSSARPWAKSVRRTVVEGSMPPWFADEKYGEFSNRNVLSDEERNTIVKWVNAGAPAGNPADAPEPVEFPVGWQIGEPDEIFKMQEPYTLGAEGPDEYKYFTIPTNLTEDKWVTAFEVRAGNTAVVHHVIAFVVPEGAPTRGEGGVTVTNSFRPESPQQLEEILARQESINSRLKESGMKPRPIATMLGGLNILGGVAPGTPPWKAREGSGKLLPKGSNLIFQMHYHRNGQEEIDQTSIGVIYADAPVTQARDTVGVANLAFAVPPHAPNYRVDSWHTFDEPVKIVGFMPHMHLRGKAFEYSAIYPDGREEILLSIPNYDFDWQLSYEAAEPLAIPAGTTIHCIAHFDNSSDNAANPDPEAVLRFGEPTEDEMMIGWLEITRDRQVMPETHE